MSNPEQTPDFGAAASWVLVDANNSTDNQAFSNNSPTETCQISFNGTDVHLTLLPGQSFHFQDHNLEDLYVRNASLTSVPGHKVHIVCWNSRGF